MDEKLRLEVLKKVKPYKRKAWKPITIHGDSDADASKFSGMPALEPAEQWPPCKHCGEPMQLFIQLNIAQLPDRLRSYFQTESGFLQMFYCTNVDPFCEEECKAYLPFGESSLVRIIKPESYKIPTEPPEDDFYLPARTIIDWKEVTDYPSWEELEDMGIKLANEENDVLNEMETPVDGDKFAGWHYWLQGVEYPRCPECKEKMRLLFQLDSEDNLPYMFGDAGCGYITRCSNHPDILAFSWAGH